MAFSFRPLTRSDFSLLQQWLTEPHIDEWWHQALDLADMEVKYGPRVDGVEPTYLFIIFVGEKPIGWIQWYRWADYLEHALKLGAPIDTAGIDLAIGQKELIGQGLGSMIITEFVNRIVFTNSDISAVVSDPEENNTRSIRAFEKAGFVTTRVLQPPGEAVTRRVVTLARDRHRN